MVATSSSSWLRTWGWVGVTIAIAMQLLAMMHETPPEASLLAMDSPSVDRSLEDILHGNYDDTAINKFSFHYNLVEIEKTPSGTGSKLEWLSWFVTRSWLSPILLRYMLDKNGIGLVRKLVSSKPYIQSLPVTHHPVHKATKDQMEVAQKWKETYSTPNSGGLTRYESMLVENYSPSSNGVFRSVLDYHHVYASGTATPTAVMDRWIEGATHHLQHLRAFAALDPVLIQQQAKESSERWKNGTPLSVWDGVPVAIKDQSAIAGLAVCHGSSICSPVSDTDDLPSLYSKQAGAIVVGTTVMTEGGVTPLGYNAHFDGPFSPYDPKYYSGGSSSGSAVAVASGLVPMAVGWDGGGSIRVPAAMTGMVGLAPTFGRVPFLEGNGSTNVKAGPIGASIVDVALGHLLLGQVYRSNTHRVLYNELFGEHYLPDPHLHDLMDDMDSNTKNRPLEGIRLGIFWDHFNHTDPEIKETAVEVVRFLEQELGATIIDITIPYIRELHLAHGMKILSEFGKTWEHAFYSNQKQLEANTEISVMLGRSLKACELLAAETLRTFGIRYVREYLFGALKLDAIVSPALGSKIPKTPDGFRTFGESNVPLVYKVMRYVPMVNFFGLPALVVPVGYESRTKLPIGFQFWGDAWSESKLLKLGKSVEDRFWTHGNQKRTRPVHFFDVLEPWLGTNNNNNIKQK